MFSNGPGLNKCLHLCTHTHTHKPTSVNDQYGKQRSSPYKEILIPQENYNIPLSIEVGEIRPEIN